MSKQVQDQNKQNYKFQNKKLLFASTILILFMIVIVVGSMLFFRAKIKESAEVISALDYQKYDNYYVLIADDKGTSFWQNLYVSMREIAKESGAYVEKLGDSLNTSYDKLELMQMAIQSGVDGIILEADETEEMTKLINQATGAGIPVVTVLEDDSQSTRQSFVGISSYNLGRDYGNQIGELVRNKNLETASVLVLLDTSITGGSQNTVLTGMTESLEQQDMSQRVTLSMASIPNATDFAPEEAIRDIFLSHQEPLPDILVCLNEKNTICAYQAVVDYNKVGQVEILGYYESETIAQAIQNQIIYATMTIDPVQMGNYCVEALNEYKEFGYVSDYYAVDTTLLNAQSLQERLEAAHE